MEKVLYQLISLLKKELGLYMGISFGLAFFVFIFKPFPLDHLDDDARELIKIGLGVIVFLVIFLVRIIYRYLMGNSSDSNRMGLSSSPICWFIIWLVSSVVISFYLMYIATASLSPYLVFKVILICLVPPVILRYYDKIAELKIKNELLELEGKIKQKKFDKDIDENLSKTIELFSEKRSKNFTMPAGDILFIRSADNYAEINYVEGGQHKKKLMRITLRNIETQLKSYTNFIRCHRMFIVNIQHFEKLNRNCNHHVLVLKGLNEEIPVSRQYLIKIREAI
jgi:hypothetical protein